MIKCKATQPKDFSLTLTLDRRSAEILSLFLCRAVDDLDMPDITTDIYDELCKTHFDVTIEDVENTVASIISGVNSEVAV